MSDGEPFSNFDLESSAVQISALDDQIACVEAELQRLKDARGALVRTQAAHANALLPVARLPPEIWTKIFRCRPAVVDDDPKTLMTISHTCQRWRAIACSDPLLWSTINVAQLSNSLTVLWLSRCEELPLIVLAKGAIPAPLLEQSHRWTVLVYSPSRGVGSFQSMVASRFCALRTLHYGGPFLQLIRAGFPVHQIEHLSTTRNGLRTDLPAVARSTNLVSLEMSFIISMTMHISNPFRLIHLGTLVLRCHCLDDGTFGVIDSFVLPALRSLSFIIHTSGFCRDDPSIPIRALILRSACALTTLIIETNFIMKEDTFIDLLYVCEELRTLNLQTLHGRVVGDKLVGLLGAPLPKRIIPKLRLLTLDTTMPTDLQASLCAVAEARAIDLQ